ncbi:hypothetical protein EW026_g7205 [Hermanssonia centrifuga]|uniref:Uncharacterized protein n=1 Tax=Hermanssonia centrifuga TaxID=98765 RepID=A0A4S4KAC4_9APHY|nr:hypothetical protein EW026_g7205 [Hermanssonia centrifuga]
MGRNGRVVTVNVDKRREFDREGGVTKEDKVVDDGVEGAAEVIVGGEIEKDVVVDDNIAGDEDEVNGREEVIAEDEEVTVEEEIEDEGTIVLDENKADVDRDTDDDDNAGEEIGETDWVVDTTFETEDREEGDVSENDELGKTQSETQACNG